MSPLQIQGAQTTTSKHQGVGNSNNCTVQPGKLRLGAGKGPPELSLLSRQLTPLIYPPCPPHQPWPSAPGQPVMHHLGDLEAAIYPLWASPSHLPRVAGKALWPTATQVGRALPRLGLPLLPHLWDGLT